MKTNTKKINIFDKINNIKIQKKLKNIIKSPIKNSIRSKHMTINLKNKIKKNKEYENNINFNNNTINNSFNIDIKNKYLKLNKNLSDKKNINNQTTINLKKNKIFRKISYDLQNIKNNVIKTSHGLTENNICIENSFNEKTSTNNFKFKLQNNNESISNNSKITSNSKISNPFKSSINYYNKEHYKKIKEKIIIQKDNNIIIYENFKKELNIIKINLLKKINTNFQNKFENVWKSYINDHSKKNIMISSKEIDSIQNYFLKLLNSEINLLCIKNNDKILKEITENINNNISIKENYDSNNSYIKLKHKKYVNNLKEYNNLKKDYFSAYETNLLEINNYKKNYKNLINKNIKQYQIELKYKLLENNEMVINILSKGKIFLKNKINNLIFIQKNIKKIKNLKNKIKNLEKNVYDLLRNN